MLNSFNTPFYPDILVATSILQEGVNLQYFCKNIYHYGMAWTPGDNEQRIGRIDRMFGKIERDLNRDPKAALPIYYPYLKNTVDEEHLAKFVKKKYREETLIDLGKSFKEEINFSLEDSDHNNWREFLRTEPSTEDINDPYPALKTDFDAIKPIAFTPKSFDPRPIFHSIMNALKELDGYAPDCHFIQQDDQFKVIIDPTLVSGRKQPVVIEALFDPVGTGFLGEAVYCLRMKTPLAATSSLRHFRNTFYSNTVIQESYTHGIKLCLDISQTGGSLWGMYMAADLPLFMHHTNENPLSRVEVKHAFKHLIECADLTEQRVFANQDLQLEALNLVSERKGSTSGHVLRQAAKKYSPNWQRSGEYYVLCEKIHLSVNDVVKFTFMENHNNFYVKTTPIKGGRISCSKAFMQEVSYLQHDTQVNEIALLAQHYRLARGNLLAGCNSK